MGGATRPSPGSRPICQGLSPRGRGNLSQGTEGRSERRSIPAWAGQPVATINCSPRGKVYPRVGGATSGATPMIGWPRGLSPRGRGNLRALRQGGLRHRSIPAWAGQPASWEPAASRSPVYPRVGGATTIYRREPFMPDGLSPRGRGNPTGAWVRPATTGSIPAWAGQPTSARRWSTPWPVYPRVGGATGRGGPLKYRYQGLSPRGRGNLSRAGLNGVSSGSIPAWAGQPSSPSPSPMPGTVYPRVGGATCSSRPSPSDMTGLSPRGRGNPCLEWCLAVSMGSIPAWAGQPRAAQTTYSPRAVYPRVGGATHDLKLQR